MVRFLEQGMPTTDPVKLAAYWKVQNAIKTGRLARQPCKECGAKKSQAHHEDYSKPLDVEWLCVACHNRKKHPVTEERRRKISLAKRASSYRHSAETRKRIGEASRLRVRSAESSAKISEGLRRQWAMRKKAAHDDGETIHINN
jgi:hypothetical protein